MAAGPVEVADEKFDVSILSIGQQPLQGDFVVRPLAASTFALCASAAYLQRCAQPQQPEDLLQHDGLLPDVAAVRRELTLFREARGSGGATRRMLEVSLRPPVYRPVNWKSSALRLWPEWGLPVCPHSWRQMRCGIVA